MKFKKHEIALMAFMAIIIVASCVIILLVVREYSAGEVTYIAFREYVSLPEETPAESQPAGVPEMPEAEGNERKEYNVDTAPPEVDFADLQALNPDIIGWIYSAGTPVNYPIVQGETNEEYLYRMADGSGNKCVSIFLDCENDGNFQDANNVIHGHNMSNGSMFAELKMYAEQEYYDKHPKIWLVTPDRTYGIEIFAAFVTTTDSEVWRLTFSSEEEFNAWKSEMVRSSYIKSKVFSAEGETVVTLSTCSYEFDNAHFVVMGILR